MESVLVLVMLCDKSLDEVKIQIADHLTTPSFADKAILNLNIFEVNDVRRANYITYDIRMEIGYSNLNLKFHQLYFIENRGRSACKLRLILRVTKR